VLNERHLRRILREYLDYYHTCRTHLSLNKDSPKPRTVQPPDMGKVTSFPLWVDYIIATDVWRHRHLVRESTRIGRDLIFRMDRG
jgi:hypothetical protein